MCIKIGYVSPPQNRPQPDVSTPVIPDEGMGVSVVVTLDAALTYVDWFSVSRIAVMMTNGHI
jgi:hypothetical protein